MLCVKSNLQSSLVISNRMYISIYVWKSVDGMYVCGSETDEIRLLECGGVEVVGVPPVRVALHMGVQFVQVVFIG